jgi:hypothetical protein
MKIPRGHFRKLTDQQISHVLKWHQEGIEFRCAHGTVNDLASLLGVSSHAVRRCFGARNLGIPKGDRMHTSHFPGRCGRRRHLNPAQMAFALAWRRAGRQFHAQHGTVATLAHKLGVGASTIHDCIRRKGLYQQRADAHQNQAHGSGRAYLPTSMSARIAALLRAWPRR